MSRGKGEKQHWEGRYPGQRVFNPPVGRERFLREDVGAEFWRVQYGGNITEYEIKGVNDETGKGKFLLHPISRETGHRNCTVVKGVQEFGLDVFRGKEFFVDYPTVVETARNRYEREINPNGVYRVARYFDDMWEAWETGELSKEAAYSEASRLNSSRARCYVSYRAEGVTKGRKEK